MVEEINHKLSLEDTNSFLLGEIKYYNKPHDYNNRSNNVFHLLSFSGHRPDKNHNSQNSRSNVEMYQVHNFFSFLSKVIEIIKKKAVRLIPNMNVYAGKPPVNWGENIPTTSDTNIILAPSRKKSDKTFAIFSPDEKKYSTQLSNSSSVYFEHIISIEPLGNLHVYDIEVEGTHNFVAEGIVAHNTFISPQDSGLRDKKQSISSIEGNKGGIDLNPKNLEIDVRGESIDLPKLNIPFDIQNFQGFTFHIIKIEVIKDLNSVLNIPEREPKEKRKHLSSYKDRSKAFCSLK